MKLRISIIFCAVILLFSCRSDNDEPQIIDQVLNLYMKNAAGQDLLNPKIKGSYSSVVLLDLLADTDLKSFSGYSLMKDADTVTYLDYPAGAIRLLQSSISPEQKTYYSQFVIRLSKTENSSTIIDDDIIKIEYTWTPRLFQLSKLYYNDELKFTKTQGQPNVVTIVK